MSERGGPGKLRSYWEQTVYVVKNQVNDNPIYKVCPEKGGKVRTLHWNLLHLVNELPVMVTQQSGQASNKAKPRKRTQVERHEQKISPASFEQSESDDEVSTAQYWFRVPRRTGPERSEMANREPQSHLMPASPHLKQTRPTRRTEGSRLQPSGAPEEQEFTGGQSDNEGRQVAEDENDSEHEQEQAPRDSSYDEAERSLRGS